MDLAAVLLLKVCSLVLQNAGPGNMPLIFLLPQLESNA